MVSSNRNTRSSLRRKMVLPVTVIRPNSQKEQSAHTLDLTGISARLGGLSSLLEPGEIIEIQRGGAKARFQVFWMGKPGSAMEGQAGIRSMEPENSIWGVNLPPDEPDMPPDASVLRNESASRPVEKRWHTRFECSGGASVRAQGTGYPVHGQVKDIARGGVYVETTTPLVLNAEVYVKMNVEGVAIESLGVVRTSYPLVGMGISFQNISAENQERLDYVIQMIRSRAATPKNLTEPALAPSTSAQEQPGSGSTNPASVLATACRMLAADFEEWKTARSTAELDELRALLANLQQKLAPPPQVIDPLSTAPQNMVV
jgi:hypothetical protein